MYTIGQVAKFLGVSRDALKYYEEKELVRPIHDDENGYRKYNHFDIHDIITTNFYRGLDLEIRRIQDIRQSKSVENVENVLGEKEAEILDDIEYKQQLLRQIRSVKEDCGKIYESLGKFTIKEMKPFEIKGEISDSTAYHEYDVLKNSAESFKKVITLTGVRRIIHFDEQGFTEDRFIVGSNIDNPDKNSKNEVLAHPQCIYTVIENGRAIDDGKNIDHQVGERLFKFAQENQYELAGVAYINILLTTYQKGLERVFVEMYAPIK